MITSTTTVSTDKCPIFFIANYIFVSLHFTFSAFPMIIPSSTLLPSAIFTSVIMARKEISSWIYSNIQTVTCQFPPS